MNSVRLDGKRMKCSSSTREKLLHLKKKKKIEYVFQVSVLGFNYVLL